MHSDKILFIIFVMIYSANLFAQKGTSAHGQSKKATSMPVAKTTEIFCNDSEQFKNVVQVEERVEEGSEGGHGK